MPRRGARAGAERKFASDMLYSAPQTPFIISCLSGLRPLPQISERDAAEGGEADVDGQGAAAAASAAADDAGAAAAAAASPVAKHARGADRTRAAVEATARCVVCWFMPASSSI